jgi:hypothetical protein
MKGIHQIKIKGISVDIEITDFQPFVKGNTDATFEFSYPSEPMGFEWRARTDNELLNLIIEEDLFEYVEDELRKQLNDKSI